MYVFGSTRVFRCLWWAEEGIGPEARVPGGCELPAVGAGTRTLVLCKSSTALERLSLSRVLESPVWAGQMLFMNTG